MNTVSLSIEIDVFYFNTITMCSGLKKIYQKNSIFLSNGVEMTNADRIEATRMENKKIGLKVYCGNKRGIEMHDLYLNN